MEVKFPEHFDFEESSKNIPTSPHDEHDRELALRKSGSIREIGDQWAKGDKDTVLKHGRHEIKQIKGLLSHQVI